MSNQKHPPGTRYSNSIIGDVATDREVFGFQVFVQENTNRESFINPKTGALTSVSLAERVRGELVQDAAQGLLSALEDVTAELSQLHSHYHPACEGGCPTVEYIMNARKVIAKAKGA